MKHIKTGTYVPPPEVMRLGAEDYKKYPSLVSGQRKPYSPPKPVSFSKYWNPNYNYVPETAYRAGIR